MFSENPHLREAVVVFSNNSSDGGEILFWEAITKIRMLKQSYSFLIVRSLPVQFKNSNRTFY